MMPQTLSQSSKLTPRSWFPKKVMMMSVIMMHPMPATTTQAPLTLVVTRVTKVIPPGYHVKHLFKTRTGDDWDELERKVAKCECCLAIAFVSWINGFTHW